MMQPTKWMSKMKKMFGLVAVDESHEYRNRSTQAWASIKRSSPLLFVIISATPMISSVSGFWNISRTGVFTDLFAL